MKRKLVGLIALLALCFVMTPTTADAAGASCPPGYRVNDDGGCTKIPGGTPPASGGGSGWDSCSTQMAECLAACIFTFGGCIIGCDAKYVACEQGAPFGL